MKIRQRASIWRHAHDPERKGPSCCGLNHGIGTADRDESVIDIDHKPFLVWPTISHVKASSYCEPTIRCRNVEGDFDAATAPILRRMQKLDWPF